MTEAPASGYKAYMSKIRQWGCTETKYIREEIGLFCYGVYFEMGVLKMREIFLWLMRIKLEILCLRKSIHELRIASFMLIALDRISIDK